MLRKTAFLASMLFAISTPGLASQGFYLGIGAGPQFANIHQDSTIYSPRNYDVSNKTQLAGSGAFINFFGGYAWLIKKFYIAGEASADISNDLSQSSNGEYIHENFTNTKYKLYNSFGLGVLPGVLITDKTIFYGRLGYTAGSFRIVTSDISLKGINLYLSGFRYGFGVKQAFTPNFGARMEYSHVSYTSANCSTLDGIVAKTTTFYPQTSQVEFALVYSFA